MNRAHGDNGVAAPENRRNGGSIIQLAAPWRMRVAPQGNAASGLDEEVGRSFIEERSRVHETYLMEEARNKRLGLILAFLLILGAAVIVLFAPEGREMLSYWVGAAMVVFAAGAAGFSRVWANAKLISFGADQDRRPTG